MRTGSLILATLLLVAPLTAGEAATGFAAARAALVAELRAQGRYDPPPGQSGFSGRVLTAMNEVPRHEFVPKSELREAYDNHPLPIGHGQTISQPYIVALMSEALGIGPGDRVLEIGTGSGYQAAVLAEIVPEVCTMELREALAGVRDAADPHTALDALLRDIGAMIKSQVAQLAVQFEESTPQQLEAAKQTIQKMQFLNKLYAEAEAVEAALEDELG